MRWLERLGFLVAGGVISAAILLALGKIELAGDFAANVAGATIGGTRILILPGPMAQSITPRPTSPN